jgi:biotin transport system substrate-specific component
MTPEAATLRLAFFPRSGLLTDVLLVLGGVGFVALAAQVSVKLPFTPVPITGQTFAVVLVGAALGARQGLASPAVYN